MMADRKDGKATKGSGAKPRKGKAPSGVSRRHTREGADGTRRTCLFWTDGDADGPLAGFCRSPGRRAVRGLLGFVPECGKCGCFVDRSEARPCPFCGGRAVGRLDRRGGRFLFYMACSACGASTDRFADDGSGGSAATALAAWNRRTA